MYVVLVRHEYLKSFSSDINEVGISLKMSHIYLSDNVKKI